MKDPTGNVYRIRRIVWLTIVGFLVWPVSLLMAWSYPEEKKYWMRVFYASLAATAIVLVCLAMKGAFSE
jgi:hypothetical protein